MNQLLLPYAYDTNNNLVHIDNAQKGQKYFCPNCRAELVLRISKIPDGQPYHKVNHFAHKGKTDNHCSESYLHKHFKDECAKLIRTKISQEARLNFEWICQYCQKKHNYNLLSNVTEVITEYNLKEYRPDIALVDNNNNIIFAIEVYVKHFPESKVLQYYSDNNISCIVIAITDFADCDNIEKKLTHPSRYFLNPKPFCDGCDKMINRKIPKKHPKIQSPIEVKDLYCPLLCSLTIVTRYRFAIIPFVIMSNQFILRVYHLLKNRIGAIGY